MSDTEVVENSQSRRSVVSRLVLAVTAVAIVALASTVWASGRGTAIPAQGPWGIWVSYPEGDSADCYDEAVEHAFYTTDYPGSSLAVTFVSEATREDVERVLACMEDSLTSGEIEVGQTGANSRDAPVERTEWLLSEVSGGAALRLHVFAGGSSCIAYERVDVQETPETVTLAAFVRRSGTECSEDFVGRDVTVELDEPIGERRLLGCAGADIAVKGWHLDPETDCREVQASVPEPA